MDSLKEADAILSLLLLLAVHTDIDLRFVRCFVERCRREGWRIGSVLSVVPKLIRLLSPLMDI